MQLAAGALQAAQQLAPEAALEAECPREMSDGALGAALKLMLAQAQVCFCEKAEKDGLCPGTQAKLCVGARDLLASPSHVPSPRDHCAHGHLDPVKKDLRSHAQHALDGSDSSCPRGPVRRGAMWTGMD